jgi:hypothetical protein
MTWHPSICFDIDSFHLAVLTADFLTACQSVRAPPLQGDDVFFAATGVSDGDMLRGVRYFSGGASTNSIVMRCKSGTGE